MKKLDTEYTSEDLEVIKNDTYRGTRIQLGNKTRRFVNKVTEELMDQGFVEIEIPTLQLESMFSNKVGDNNKMMFKVESDKHKVCLAPEYTAIIQSLALDRFKYKKDLKVFYVGRCYRGERPQAGRFREFTQVGVEIINPTKDYSEELQNLARHFVSLGSSEPWENIIFKEEVSRGLEYYKEGKGFEIKIDSLGSSNQVCGGGEYEGGIGFALGVDRILLT